MVGLHNLFFIFAVVGIQLVVGYTLFGQITDDGLAEKNNIDSKTVKSNQEWIVEQNALSPQMLNFYKAYVLIRDHEAMGSAQEVYLEAAKKKSLLSGDLTASILEKLQARLKNAKKTAKKKLTLTVADQQLISHVWFYAEQMLALLEKLKQTPFENVAEYEYLQTILYLDISKMLVILSGVHPESRVLGCEYAIQAELLASKGFNLAASISSTPNGSSSNVQKRLKSEQLRVQGDVFSTQAECIGFPKNISYFSRSRRLFDQALKLDPKNFKAKLAKGVYYYFPPIIFGGNLKKAAKQMDAVAKQGNRYESYLAYAWLSQVYFKMNEKEKSGTTLKQAANLYPNGKLLFYMAQANADGKPLE